MNFCNNIPNPTSLPIRNDTLTLCVAKFPLLEGNFLQSYSYSFNPFPLQPQETYNG